MTESATLPVSATIEHQFDKVVEPALAPPDLVAALAAGRACGRALP